MKFFKKSFILLILFVSFLTIYACKQVKTPSNTTKTSIETSTTDPLSNSNNPTEIYLSLEVEESIIKIDQIYRINYESNDSFGVTFASSNKNVASVDEDGHVKGESIGPVTIYVSSISNPDITKEINLVVIKPDPFYITLSGTDFVEVGNYIELTARITPETSNSEVIWSSADESVATVDENGKVTGLAVGKVKIIASAKYNSFVLGEMEIDVIAPIPTEITISGVTLPVIIGDVVKLNATVKPTFREGVVIWSINNSNIATITPEGELTAKGVGTVTVSATLSSDQTIIKTETITIRDVIYHQDLFNLIEVEKQSNLKFYNLTAYGATNNYQYKTYGSISNYYFGNIEIKQKLIPIGASNRPGKMSPLPTGITRYNDKNIYWIVIHDTGNTLPSANALLHSNYVLNPTTATSWHYTVDDKEIYQHLPDDEQGYHAGDGINQVGQGSYLGGGNKNGIGIEMAVNEGSDLFKTWQRTAKLTAQLLVKYNLPLENFRYHINFSGKICPQTLIRANLRPLFEQMVAIEYKMAKYYGDAQITMKSLNPQYLDNTGRIIQFPSQTMVLRYEVTITKEGKTTTLEYSSLISPVTN